MAYVPPATNVIRSKASVEWSSNGENGDELVLNRPINDVADMVLTLRDDAILSDPTTDGKTAQTISGNVTFNGAIAFGDGSSPVIKDSATGAAHMPSGSTAQRPVSPVNGYMRYNSDLLAMEAYANGVWGSVGGGATGGGTDKVFNNNGYTVTSNYTIPSGMSAITVGDSNGNVTINSGVTVTLSAGSRWVCL
jgi:hypothetical protein